MNTPQHLALIPDGNRRWAKRQSAPPWDGHRKGAAQFRTISTAAFKSGVSFVTVWAASQDNLLKRSKIEISWLIKIFIEYLQDKEVLPQLQKDHIRFQVLGRGQQIIKNKKLDKAISDLEAATSAYSRRTLTILFGYDGTREMLDVIEKLSQRLNSRHLLALQPGDVKKMLWTRDLPAVDLVIRTGEEQSNWAHWSSGFMMWDTANAEFVFTPTLWPDFSEKELSQVLQHYHTRVRRNGA